MKTNPLKERTLTENSAGISKETSKIARQRRVEHAANDGHSALRESKSECEQARRELTGETDSDPNEASLGSAPESEC
jgi:hypothetical protein